MRRLAFVGIVGVLVSGCLLDPQAGYRPARFHAGPNMRALSVPIASAGGGDATTTAQRSSSTVEPTDPARDRLSAVSAALQFTMAYAGHIYVGGEVETGKLEGEGSNFAGAYGIAGGQHDLGFGTIGVELATGWRGLRYHFGDDDENQLVFEPRVRAQLWLSKQITLGGAFGTTLGAAGEWMAGVYIGVHSHEQTF